MSKLNFKNTIGALAVSAALMTGCVDNQEDPVAKETIQSISDRMADFCRRAASDVDDLKCVLSEDGQKSATLMLGCWSGKGWSSVPKQLKDEYDEMDIDRDCVIRAAQY
jgi:hypothetical protein